MFGDCSPSISTHILGDYTQLLGGVTYFLGGSKRHETTGP